MDPNRCWRAFLILATLTVLILGGLVVRALAHDWYPTECCGGIDCAPASMTTVASAAYLMGIGGEKSSPFTTTVTVDLPYMAGGRQTVIVPPDFPQRESKDGRMHACIVAGKLRCLFMPPAM
jgi:hypothetical protein